METQELKAELVQNRGRTYAVVTVPASTEGVFYRVDVTNGRCSCPAWKFAKGHTRVCKHLHALGFLSRAS